ncbi:hypothetical protein D3C73_1170970 [compost metagenome]
MYYEKHCILKLLFNMLCNNLAWNSYQNLLVTQVSFLKNTHLQLLRTFGSNNNAREL